MRAFLRLRSALLAAAVAPCAFVGPAWAGSPITYVSSAGADSGDCATTATACRTFGYAVGQTAVRGEVKAITPGQFGAFTIGKSLTVSGVEGAMIRQYGVGDAVTVAAGVADVVNIIGLELVGSGAHAPEGIAFRGVNALSAGALTVKNCVIRDFWGAGVAIAPTVGQIKFLIEDTTVINVGQDGVWVRSTPRTASGAIRHLTVNGAGSAGVYVDYWNHVSVTDSLVTNSSVGYAAGGQAGLEIAHSTASQNVTGLVRYGGGSKIESAGNNFIRDNATNVSGVVTVVGGQ
ncbi:right-handed parallel beta-helix repeat-containing protein [Methylosinus sp. Sm6]|uniref:right-handed parallel beta-helix repeat-containing protein n=1 Tax=Methylosinus sp. Sm6 TaxID=2866948 RepID=UPI001C99D50F|nr:right-handed parallel beta-helix repeat-containing protein [Methylosinus sp. Sm6]MBY6241882.1 right-handed parallel beta-helix repeat-containing protein [Methylosinus sp. Sm6]